MILVPTHNPLTTDSVSLQIVGQTYSSQHNYLRSKYLLDKIGGETRTGVEEVTYRTRSGGETCTGVEQVTYRTRSGGKTRTGVKHHVRGLL